MDVKRICCTTNLPMVHDCGKCPDAKVSAADFDAVQGKLKVAVAMLQEIADNPDYDNAYSLDARKALAQIGLPEKEVGCS